MKNFAKCILKNNFFLFYHTIKQMLNSDRETGRQHSFPRHQLHTFAPAYPATMMYRIAVVYSLPKQIPQV